MEFYVCVPFGEIVAHTDEGLLERRGLIAIDELVIFFDPSIPTSTLSYGEEAASTVSVESLSFFFLFRYSSSSSGVLIILCTSKATRPDASRTRQYILLLLLFPSSFLVRALSSYTSPLFHLFPYFKERHENTGKYVSVPRDSNTLVQTP